MSKISNSEKAKHGQSAHIGMEGILKRCVSSGYLALYIKNYGVGKSGYKSVKQFYAPFLLVFHDGTKWAIFTTTSMRTDRIKGQQWDAFNLKDLDSKITHVYLVYPDGLENKELSEFYKNNKYLIPLDIGLI